MDDLGIPKVDSFKLERQQQQLLAKMFGVESEPPRFGRYVILDELGSGGMGVVYKAHDPKLNRYVAIKLITRDDAKMRDRFRREAHALAQVKHPNVIDIYDTDFDENGRPYIAMEYVDGQTLKEWLRSARDIYDIFKVFVSASRGLAVVHDEGIVHHDFKPENVLVGKDGRVRVADFGLARASGEMFNMLGAQRHSDAFKYDITQTGALLGTVPYMAPELLVRGGARGNARTDQFAFCVSLYEALAGERLFRGNDFSEVRAAILRCEVKPLPRAKKIPRRVEIAIRKGLSALPEDRHASMTELTGLLRRVSKRPERRRWFTWAAASLTGVLAIVGAYVSAKAILDNSSTSTEPGIAAEEPEVDEQPTDEPESVGVLPPKSPEQPPEDPKEDPRPSPDEVQDGDKDISLPSPQKRKPKRVEVKLHSGTFDTAIFDFGLEGTRTVSTAETIELPATKITVKCREYDANEPRGWMKQSLDLGSGKRTIKCLEDIGPRLE